ncbi:MAG: Ribosomal RNA small subunit methyltransferase A [Candidatus Kaiserbacteria bacterium GW2011_GWC2_49_12]|uniref:Ribosomal RNA small subunit methyltransferase A n=3 Tax=Candidatus Kaiseribacteriota TaxID=1752734 RepID=A0A0G1YQC6_9BACT|nr:MAG: Ribosomal RNA small subunit methyltransferase A [Candidatus Kaiserbacteria bacterium GW2011_GWC2_49_12]KKW17192.1 MAG: Ribosomal RNA small subunit methyltransferase A [Candidatus Kaiserbacteria bacterium GW2011_GWB1_50_17]OGG88260.1 MAG: ribosomal RNA small subunit methyltransferase A [Candidatus Kaiserbacteria bacterium RIFCSPLOWO2_12_FULL_50_28]
MGQRLGQHFLKTPWAARALAQAVGIGAKDTVLEIGPGKGALTRELLKTGARVVAIEKDEILADFLREKFAVEIASGLLTMVPGDIRDISPEELDLKDGTYVVAANIPYYITGEIIRQFLTTRAKPRAMALLVQKEVAQRIVSKRESLLSLSVKAYGMPRVAAKVSRKNFSPPPAVDSAILVIESISTDFFKDLSEERFFKTIRAGFAQKRKFLVNNLAMQFRKSEMLEAFRACNVDNMVRAENVPLETWKCLVRATEKIPSL